MATTSSDAMTNASRKPARWPTARSIRRCSAWSATAWPRSTGPARTVVPERTLYRSTDEGAKELVGWTGEITPPAPFVTNEIFAKVVVFDPRLGRPRRLPARPARRAHGAHAGAHGGQDGARRRSRDGPLGRLRPQPPGRRSALDDHHRGPAHHFDRGGRRSMSSTPMSSTPMTAHRTVPILAARGSPRRTAGPGRCAAPRSSCARARSSPSPARAAAASPPCCTAWPESSAPTRARSSTPSSASTS